MEKNTDGIKNKNIIFKNIKMEDSVIQLLDNGIDSVCEFLMDPVLRDEMFEANDGNFFPKDNDSKEESLSDSDLDRIDEMENDEFVKITNSKEIPTFEDFFDFVKETMRLKKARYITGSFAIFMYMKKLGEIDNDEFFPNDIDIIVAPEKKINSPRNRRRGSENSDDIDSEEEFFEIKKEKGSEHFTLHSNDYYRKSKFGKNFFPKDVTISNYRVEYAELDLREKYLSRKNISWHQRRAYLNSEHLFNQWGKPSINKLQFISKEMNVFDIKNFVEDFDINVAKIIYDVASDNFIFVDNNIEKELVKRETTYIDQPFNYFLDRNGIRRKTVKALLRIIKYIDRGFKIKKPSGDYFTRKEIMKEINETRYLQSNNLNRNINFDPNWTDYDKNSFFRYETDKYRWYGIVQFMREKQLSFCKKLPGKEMEKYKEHNDFPEKLLSILDKEKAIEILGPDYEKIISTIPENRTLKEKLSGKFGNIDSKDKKIMKDVIEYLIDDLGVFLSKKEIQYSISGSSVLFLQLGDESCFIPNDLDIWLFLGDYSWCGKNTTEDNIINRCWPDGYGMDDYNDVMQDILHDKINEINNILREYIQPGSKKEDLERPKNYHPSNITFDAQILDGAFKIQFIVPIVKKYKTALNPTLNFDMEFCRSYYNGSKEGKILYVDKKTELAIKNRKSDYTPGRHNFVASGDDLILNELSIERVNKYISRGFELYFMNKKIEKGEDVIIPNGVNENLDYFFLKRYSM